MFFKKCRGFIYRFYKMSIFYPLLVSCIIIVIGLGYVIESLSDFYTLQHVTRRKVPLRIDTFRFYLRNTLKKELLRLSAPEVPRTSPLTSFYITADTKDFTILNADLPRSGKEQYISAYMKTSDSPDIKRVQLRYRGANNSHWLYPQKSLRIKLRNRDIYNMEKKLNLVNPPQAFTLPLECTNYSIARKIGIIAPDYFPIRVFINGKYMGVYSYLSQVDESLMRKHRRMPGSIYRGDGAPIGKDGISMLWRDETFWNKVGARNSEQLSNRDDIKHFINAVNKFDDTRFFHFAETFLDKEKFFKFYAIDVIFGCGHHDYHHNHKIYFDPYKGRFEPISWNMGDWKYSYPTGKKDFSYNPLLHRIKMNPILESERDRICYNLLKQLDLKSIYHEYDRFAELIINDLKADVLRDHRAFLGGPFKQWVSTTFGMDFYKKLNQDKKKVLKLRQKFLDALYENAMAHFFLEKINRETYRLTFRVNGNSGVTFRLSQWVRSVSRPLKKGIDIYQDINLNGKIDTEDRIITDAPQHLFPGRKIVPLKNTMSDTLAESFKILFGDIKAVNAPMYYSYIVKADVPSKIEKIKAVNIVTGTPLNIYHRQFKIGIEADSIHPWKLPASKKKQKVLSGKISVQQSMIFDRHTRVTILPGTTFVLSPEKSIYFYGSVSAVGTRELPIRFIPKETEKPWGIVVLQGKGASTSRLKYCRFEGGSIDTRNLIGYSGQLNLHDLANFEISNCTFARNHIGDDNLHIAYANGKIENCIFVNSRSDAIDADISNVDVKNCLFVNTGNDSLDFMTSNALVENNLFINAGDKGISIGEWSKVDLKTNIYYGCNIAVEVKDKSVVSLKRSLIMESHQKAINLYRKNDRYDSGGTVNSDYIYIHGGNRNITADKDSTVNIKNISSNSPPVLMLAFRIPGGKKKVFRNITEMKEAVQQVAANYE